MGYRCIESWNVNFGAPREPAKMQKNVSWLCKKGSLYGILEDWANKMCINCHQFACSVQMMIPLNALFSAMWPCAGIFWDIGDQPLGQSRCRVFTAARRLHAGRACASSGIRLHTPADPIRAR